MFHESRTMHRVCANTAPVARGQHCCINISSRSILTQGILPLRQYVAGQRRACGRVPPGEKKKIRACGLSLWLRCRGLAGYVSIA